MRVRYDVVLFASGITTAGLTILLALFFILAPPSSGGPWIVIVPLLLMVYVFTGWALYRAFTRAFAGDRDPVPTPADVMYHKVLRTVLLCWSGVAAGWAVFTFSQPHLHVVWLSRLIDGTVTTGAVVALASGLYLIAGAHHQLLLARFKDVAGEADPRFQRRLPPSIVRSIAVIVAAAIFLPMNVSPFHITDIDRWMAALTRRIGPYLVPKDGPWRQFGDYLSESSEQMWRFVGASEDQIYDLRPTSPIALLVQMIVVVLIAVVIARFFSSRKRRKGEHIPRSAGYVPWGFGWLWKEIKEAVVKFFSRFGWWREAEEKDERAVSDPALPTDLSAAKNRFRWDEYETIESLYAGIVRSMGRMGLVRGSSETPYEYLARWETWTIGKDESHGFPLLTEMYIEKRYIGREEADPSSGIKRAKSAAMRAMRRFRASSLVMRLRSRSFRRRKG